MHIKVILYYKTISAEMNVNRGAILTTAIQGSSQTHSISDFPCPKIFCYPDLFVIESNLI